MLKIFPKLALQSICKPTKSILALILMLNFYVGSCREHFNKIYGTNDISLNPGTNITALTQTSPQNLISTFCLTPGVAFSTVIEAVSLNGEDVSLTSVSGLPNGATISSSLPTPLAQVALTNVNWTPNVADWGTHNIEFTITSASGVITIQSYQLIVNSSPILSVSETYLVARPGNAHSISFNGNDADIVYNDSLRFEIVNLPSWMTFLDLGNGTGEIAGTPFCEDLGLTTVDVYLKDIYDECGLPVVQSITINVIPNTPPILTLSETVATISPGNAYAFFLNGVDPDVPEGDQLYYYAFNLPSWLTLLDVGDGTGELAGTPSCDDIGTITIDVYLQDLWDYCYNGPQMQTITIDIINETPPLVFCNPDITVYTEPGECSAPVSFFFGGAPNCGNLTVECDLVSGDYFNVGVSTATVIATDSDNNTSTCSFTISVIDTDTPTINCPSSITVNNDPSICGAVVNFEISSTDICNGEVISLENGIASNETFPIGITNNTYMVTDLSGNVNTCSFAVEVVDNESPIILCPDAIVVSNDTGQCSAIVNYVVQAFDNCNYTINQLNGPPSGSLYPLGITNHTFQAIDEAGFTSTPCTFSITVIGNIGDDDCDNVPSVCDVCPGADDSIDNNNDGIADCSQLLAYALYSNEWKCGTNKIKICHNGNTQCLNKNALPAKLNSGAKVGPCIGCIEDRSNDNDGLIALDVNILSNPVIDRQLFVTIDGQIEQGAYIQILDIYGHTLITQNVNIDNKDLTVNLESSPFPNGHYVLQLISGKRSISKKFTVIVE